jgi:hypothetical protein
MNTKNLLEKNKGNAVLPIDIASTVLVVHINELMKVCGYANSETPVNNHYGCNHQDCEEKEIVKVREDGSHERFPKNIEQKILMISLRKKYGSWNKIQRALKTEEGKQFANDIRLNKIYETDFIAQFGLKLQGKCYSFSCPIANACDLEDLKEYDKDLYNEWKDGDYDPSESGADLMLITDEKLIKALS